MAPAGATKPQGPGKVKGAAGQAATPPSSNGPAAIPKAPPIAPPPSKPAPLAKPTVAVARLKPSTPPVGPSRPAPPGPARQGLPVPPVKAGPGELPHAPTLPPAPTAPVALPPAAAVPPRRKRRAWRWVVAALAVLLLIPLGAAVYLYATDYVVAADIEAVRCASGEIDVVTDRFAIEHTVTDVPTQTCILLQAGDAVEYSLRSHRTRLFDAAGVCVYDSKTSVC